MRTYRFQREQWVAKPLERVFPFFARPENLALITPPGLGFRLLTPMPVIMERGRVIDYTLRLLGVPVRWRTLISHYEPPWCFVDEQLAGPYSFWHHTHCFEQRDGGTLLSDKVRYALPVALPGPAADLVNTLYVRPSLKRIFDYRRQMFTRIFAAPHRAAAQIAHCSLSPRENTP
jgi:ligand-binding SRPBCC domain-containing protein